MSKKATEFQKKEMSRMYRGKEIFKPLNTGWIDENVACGRKRVRFGEGQGRKRVCFSVFLTNFFLRD